MTSTTSSDSKILRHDIFTTIRQNLWLLITGLVILSIMLPWTTVASGIFNFNSMGRNTVQQLIARSRVTTAAVYIFVIVVYAVGCAGFSFIFALNKKAVNVYFSIGLTRGRLFVSRCIAGVAILLTGILVPMLIDLWVNVAALGATQILFSSWFYLTCGFIVQGLVAFSVTALVCAVVGAVFDGIAFSFGLLILPTLLIQAFGDIMKKLLFGCNIGVWLQFNQTDSLISVLMRFNPVLFIESDIDDYSTVFKNDSGYTIEYGSPLPPMNIGALVVWFLISAVVLALAYFLFKRRKTEFAGHGGVNRALCLIGQVGIAFFLFGELFSAFKDSAGIAVALVIAAVAFIAAFYLIGCLIKRSFKKAVQSVKLLPAFLAVSFVPVIIFATGGFGYSTRIPAAADIAKVSFSYNNNTKYVPSNYNNSNFFFSAKKCNLFFTLPKDIDTVVAIHKAIIQAGRREYTRTAKFTDQTAVPVDLKITYTLKNGETLERAYDRTTIGALTQMLKLDNTDTVKAVEARYLNGQSTRKYINYGDSTWYVSDQSDYSSGQVCLSDNCYSSSYTVKLSSEKRKKLLSCLTKDVTTQSIDNRYFSNKPSLGLLTFSGDTIYLTNQFKNTIAFLKQNGLYMHLKTACSVESVDFKCYAEAGDHLDGRAEAPYFTSQSNTFDINQADGEKEFTGKITDKATIASLLPKLRDDYFAKDGGYIVRLKLAGKSIYVYKYLPYALATPEIINRIK